MRKNQNGSFSFFAKFVYFKIDVGKYYKNQCNILGS